MKKILLPIAIFSSMLFISSCNSGGSNDPKVVLMSFWEALSKKDIEGAKKLATAETKPWLDNLGKVFEMAKNMPQAKITDEKYDKANMEFGDAKIEGDIATIPIKNKATGEVTNWPLKKESGEWKVDMLSVMDANVSDKMGPGAMDSLNTEMEKFKNMNLDSLNEVMEKSMETMKQMQGSEGMKDVDEFLKKHQK